MTPYAEWKFYVYAMHGFGYPMWFCRVDLIGESPEQVCDAGRTPLEAFCNALGLVAQAREKFNWLLRN